MLKDLYEQVDSELSSVQPECSACGKCCDFETSGHQVWASEIEIEYLLTNAPAAYPQNLEQGKCPYWRDNKCAAHNFRLLGCRAFHHDKDSQEKCREIYEKYLARIKLIVVNENLRWRYDNFLSAIGEKFAKRYD